MSGRARLKPSPTRWSRQDAGKARTSWQEADDAGVQAAWLILPRLTGFFSRAKRAGNPQPALWLMVWTGRFAPIYPPTLHCRARCESQGLEAAVGQEPAFARSCLYCQAYFTGGFGSCPFVESAREPRGARRCLLVWTNLAAFREAAVASSLASAATDGVSS